MRSFPARGNEVLHDYEDKARAGAILLRTPWPSSDGHDSGCPSATSPRMGDGTGDGQADLSAARRGPIQMDVRIDSSASRRYVY